MVVSIESEGSVDSSVASSFVIVTPCDCNSLFLISSRVPIVSLVSLPVPMLSFWTLVVLVFSDRTHPPVTPPGATASFSISTRIWFSNAARLVLSFLTSTLHFLIWSRRRRMIQSKSLCALLIGINLRSFSFVRRSVSHCLVLRSLVRHAVTCVEGARDEGVGSEILATAVFGNVFFLATLCPQTRKTGREAVFGTSVGSRGSSVGGLVVRVWCDKGRCAVEAITVPFVVSMGVFDKDSPTAPTRGIPRATESDDDVSKTNPSVRKKLHSLRNGCWRPVRENESRCAKLAQGCMCSSLGKVHLKHFSWRTRKSVLLFAPSSHHNSPALRWCVARRAHFGHVA